MKADFTEPDGKEVFINHADCLEDAEFMRQQVLKTFPHHIGNNGYEPRRGDRRALWAGTFYNILSWRQALFLVL